MEKKKRRFFPDEFKRQAVERVETSGLSRRKIGGMKTNPDTPWISR